MNKTELVAAIADQAGITKKDAEKAVKAFSDVVTKQLKKGEIHGSRMGTFVLPVVPRRCDHLRFRMKGTGEMKIYSISRIMEVGGDG